MNIFSSFRENFNICCFLLTLTCWLTRSKSRWCQNFNRCPFFCRCVCISSVDLLTAWETVSIRPKFHCMYIFFTCWLVDFLLASVQFLNKCVYFWRWLVDLASASLDKAKISIYVSFFSRWLVDFLTGSLIKKYVCVFLPLTCWLGEWRVSIMPTFQYM